MIKLDLQLTELVAAGRSLFATTHSTYVYQSPGELKVPPPNVLATFFHG
jgi:hypothetical protein